MRIRGFSLLELMVALAVLAVVLALAVPGYRSYSLRAHRVAAQADLLECAQGMERHANATMGYAGALDTDGDGIGDASAGTVSANLCRVDASRYRISVRSADAAGFVLRAEAASETIQVDGVLELDATGDRRWDRNGDGDFDDDGEHGWQP